MRKGKFHIKLVLAIGLVLLARLGYSAGYSHSLWTSPVSQVQFDEFDDLDLAEPSCSHDEGCKEVASFFKSSSARRAYKSRLCRINSLRMDAKVSATWIWQVSGPVIAHAIIDEYYPRPYYYIFLFRLTPF